MSQTIVFLLKGYPRLSETFIAQEIRELERHGVRIRIVALRRPTDLKRHPVHEEIAAEVSYLPEYLHEEPIRVAKAWWAMRGGERYQRLMHQFRADFKRDRSRNRVRRLGQALVLASELTRDDIHLHAHFLHTPATVARYAAILSGLPWTVSAHAKDIWTSPDWDLREKLASCRWAVTCTRYNVEHLRKLGGESSPVGLVYHGLDLKAFAAPLKHKQEDSITILSVGRLVEKKGYDDLIAALGRLSEMENWRFVHIGGGASAALRAQAKREGVGDRIEWLGPQSQSVVIDNYRRADVFVLASRIASDGDRDGLPNVLMEAQSQGLACVATEVSAIAELITNEVNGLLVAPGDPQRLAAAIRRLILDADLRRRLGEAGQRTIRDRFSLESTIGDLVARFKTSPDATVLPH